MQRIISKSFTFEAAHKLDTTNDIKNRNIHGHSFHVTVFIKGDLGSNGMILDFYTLEDIILSLKETLDHSFLNDVKGIDLPTLENIGEWIWNRLKIEVKDLYKVKIERKTCGERFEISL